MVFIQGGKVKNLKIIYEDNHLIVVIKPINIPVCEDSSKDLDLLKMIKNYLKEKYHKPGNVYLGLVHRLDRPVGGLMVFAKTSKAASRLSEEIRNKSFKKTYLAVTENKFDQKKGIFIDKIAKDDEGNAFISEKGKEAILDYEVLAYQNDHSLVKINLKTGRHHQIRVQMKNHHHPLCGDQRYNKIDHTQIALWAYEIEFIHPISKKVLIFKENPPKNDYFKEFLIK